MAGRYRERNVIEEASNLRFRFHNYIYFVLLNVGYLARFMSWRYATDFTLDDPHVDPAHGRIKCRWFHRVNKWNCNKPFAFKMKYWYKVNTFNKQKDFKR